MFYLTEIEDYVRVDPQLFGMPTKDSVVAQLEETYAEYYDKEVGKVVSIVEVIDIGEGVIIPGDGAAYYKCLFKVLAWKPEMHELIFCKVEEITNFGAFMNMGVMKGMIHISQTMDDFVSFSDAGSLSGKSSGRALKSGDFCLSRIVAVSHKGDEPKVGLTMRQPGLGKLEWIKEEKEKAKADVKKIIKTNEKGTKFKGVSLKSKKGSKK
ncbi:MAG: DNA-directed RNA polymerase [Nanoarchaeota archaeon]|nr:DNA-directed RNA polymerase [Nanoarchaeota archaeon]